MAVVAEAAGADADSARMTLANGINGAAPHQSPKDLDASKLVIRRAKSLKAVPAWETLRFGETPTDHMLICTYDPINGWSNPEIKPYGPLSLDPMSSCLQYATNVFEGMKAYVGPNGNPRLFRPSQNMKRLETSAARLALPAFDSSELLKLINQLVLLDSRWIPNLPGYSLYIRPTIIGTRPKLSVAASNEAMLYVVLSPTGPYFPTGPKPLSLMAVSETARTWPGGTGGHKLGINYAPALLPQQIAAKQGYDQVVWLLGEDNRITEVGAMNVFAVVGRDDGDLDVMTPSLDGTILPGVTRASCLELLSAHPEKSVLPNIPPTTRIHVHERVITMEELTSWSAKGQLHELFGVGTAVIVAPIGRIGFQNADVVPLDHPGGFGPVGGALMQRLSDIQTGKWDWEGWSVELSA
ncbi:hypothetical protein EYR40_004565 [Pleurotus pulmonarius]|nr:hypothetical protein EYR40_004565 [Pleurotus pulmonarius]